jgi:hypothetical protein
LRNKQEFLSLRQSAVEKMYYTIARGHVRSYLKDSSNVSKLEQRLHYHLRFSSKG